MLNNSIRTLNRVGLVGLIGLCLLAVAQAIPLRAGPYRLEVTTDPATVPVGRAILVISVADSIGKPVVGATVKAIAKMPSMNMGEKEELGKPGSTPGQYLVPASFSMAGTYEARITVEGSAGSGSGSLEISTGQVTTGGSGLDWPMIAIGAVALFFVIFIVFRMRKTGQSLNAKSLLSFSVFGSLLVLAAAVALAVWLVRTQRRPGSMTPIEAQAMEMSTPAPEGVLPVVLAIVEEKPFAPSVRYSGQAVGFTEQDVVPRTTGSIIEMPVYVGDRVKKGQLLARLDTSQLDPEVDMRSAALGRSQQGVEVAAIEYQAALNEVATARAELSVAQGETREAQAMLDAAREGKEGAAADIAIADAEIANSKAALESAIATQTYARAEVERQKALADKGFVSQRDAQRAKADADKADAEVRQAEQDVQKANSTLRSAKAAERRVGAEIEAARVKVENARSNAKAKESMVRSAQRSADAAKARVAQERSSVSESSAGLRGANTQKGYALIRAESDGVIVQRLIAPGQVVAPGQAILRISRTSPIRLQANVPESDLARIHVGAGIMVAITDSAASAMPLRVTSVSPSVDSGARMGLVEALYENKDNRFVPGQFVSMSIALGKGRDALVFPTKAVDKRGDQAYVWLAEKSGSDYTIKRQLVDLGEESGEVVAVVEGLQKGQHVVVDPGPDLRDGMRVVEADQSEDHQDGLEVSVTDRGYEPSTLTIPANKETTITFTRRSDATCGAEIIFPELKINKPLPLNVPITVTIPPRPAGVLKFTCAMDMLVGKVVIQ